MEGRKWPPATSHYIMIKSDHAPMSDLGKQGSKERQNVCDVPTPFKHAFLQVLHNKTAGGGEGGEASIPGEEEEFSFFP